MSLSVCVCKGYIDVTEYLLDVGCDVDVTSAGGCTALMTAAKSKASSPSSPPFLSHPFSSPPFISPSLPLCCFALLYLSICI